MGREVGGGIGMGKTCEPKAFSFQCMTKITTKKKKTNWHTVKKKKEKETDELNLKFIWKYKGHRIAKQFLKRTNFERLYYLISRITEKLQ